VRLKRFASILSFGVLQQNGFASRFVSVPLKRSASILSFGVLQKNDFASRFVSDQISLNGQDINHENPLIF